jgi:predicted 3-demethylubiquinone-9 3-methyltransferase (glyoxalase superfamily)
MQRMGGFDTKRTATLPIVITRARRTLPEWRKVVAAYSEESEWKDKAEMASKRKEHAMAKNTIFLWYDKDAEAAARFCSKTFPDSAVGAVHRAPSDYPVGKEGDVLTVEFTVAGIPCIGLNGGPEFKHNEAFSFQIATDDQEETDRMECHRRQRRQGKRVRLVQRQVGDFLANHSARTD